MYTHHLKQCEPTPRKIHQLTRIPSRSKAFKKNTPGGGPPSPITIDHQHPPFESYKSVLNRWGEVNPKGILKAHTIVDRYVSSFLHL